MTRLRRYRVLVVLLVLTALTGCVSLPTSGPVEKVEGQEPGCQSCVNVEVAPPASGATPREIVEGYLRANANYQPNYGVARQFLTESQSDTWSPDQGVTIYTGTLTENDEDVTLTGGRVLGSLGADRTFTPRSGPLKWDFEVVEEDGEFRISKPPPGLFVRDVLFKSRYRAYDLFFVSQGLPASLVPNPVYLPDLRAPGNIASALVSGLLDGPPERLAPAVTTAIPTSTVLTADSVSIVEGVAQVSFTGSSLAQLPEQQRRLLAGQLVYTLQQVIGVKKVLVQVDSQPFKVPQSQGSDLAVPVGVDPALDPVPTVGAEQLYGVRDGALAEIDADATAPDPRPFPGALGEGRHPVSSLAVTVDDTTLAAVTDGGTVLRRVGTDGTGLATLLEGVSGLLRPQYSRTDELFAVGEQGGSQRMWVLADGSATVVGRSLFAAGEVTAFRVSPDGSRMAVVVRQGGVARVGLARIVRSGGITVEDWRELDTDTELNTSTVTDVRDVAWLNATDLLVLGRNTAGGAFVPSTISVDGSTVETEPQTLDWDGRSLAVLLQTQTATPIAVTAEGDAYRDDGTSWRPYVTGVTALAYPG